ncbi:MAG: shikimate kinase [Candidatus Diapherotrites archaeon]
MNITLIGMPGSGKSVIGKELAELLGYRFIDSDRTIEEKTGMKLQQIIDKFGYEKFIKIEEAAVIGCVKKNNCECVFSPGGSVVYCAKAMDSLRKNSLIVFLDAPFKSIYSRTENRDTRGIVGLKNKSLEELFDERLALYKKYAGLTVKVPADFNKEQVVKKIIKLTHQCSKKSSQENLCRN